MQPSDEQDRSSAECLRFLDDIGRFCTPLAVKLYRIRLAPPLAIPTLPCLDHEAMLHDGIAAHAAAYVADHANHLHEIVFVPDKRRIDVETVSSMGESSREARAAFVATLRETFPKLRVRIVRGSWLRGDRRVAAACRAQVPLRDVLTGTDLERIRTAVDRLQMISVLMEKESRVASWGARTVITPLLAVAGFVTYQVLGSMGAHIGDPWAEATRYGVVTLIGGFFLYYGLKAVHLTQMANRVWKRSAEYGLILGERRRLQKREPPSST